MTEKDIRPIPKTILKEIYKRDLKIDPWQTSIVRYYAYLAIWKKELVKVTVAVSTIQNKHWAYKQVAVHGIHTPICLVRDIEYNYFGFGYRVGWYAEELQTQQNGRPLPLDGHHCGLYPGSAGIPGAYSAGQVHL